MATPDFSTTGLLAAVRRSIFAPDASDQSDADVLAFADDVLAGFIAADMRTGREEFWVTSSDITIVPGTFDYTLPRRALAQSVRGVMVVTPQGETYELDRIDLLNLRSLYVGDGFTQTWPSKYAFASSNVIRLGSVAPESGWTLRVFYLRTPPKLVPTSEAGSIVSRASTPTKIEWTVTSSPVSALVGTEDALVDFVSGAEPYVTTHEDINVQGSLAAIITTDAFDESDVADYVINRQPDYIVPAGCTVYPPVPRTLWTALVEGTAARMLAAVRDPQAQAKMDSAMEALRDGQNIMQPRDNSKSMSIIGPTALRAAGTYRRGWGWR